MPTPGGSYQLRWTHYPPTDQIPPHLHEVVDAFQAAVPRLARFWSLRAVQSKPPELRSNESAG